jgi:hypothetical protein
MRQRLPIPDRKSGIIFSGERYAKAFLGKVLWIVVNRRFGIIIRNPAWELSTINLTPAEQPRFSSHWNGAQGALKILGAHRHPGFGEEDPHLSIASKPVIKSPSAAGHSEAMLQTLVHCALEQRCSQHEGQIFRFAARAAAQVKALPSNLLNER